MKTYRARRYRPSRKMGRRRMASVISLLVVVAGLGLVGDAFFGGDSPLLRILYTAITREEGLPTSVEDTNLKLTVPKMDRVRDLNVYTGPASDEAALEVGALHVQGTGFPWEQQANVYIAGHRLGFPGTDSYLVFWDLDKLQSGDEVILTDANGTRYTYTVFTSFVVGPQDYSVTQPLPGRNIVSLQTCTLPDYSDRLIVQAELTQVA